VERGAFDAAQELSAVRLDANQLTRMENLFHQLPNLTWLNVSANQIAEFDYAMVPRSLMWLDIHANRISALDNYFDLLAAGVRIQHLNAGLNRIRSIGPASLPNSVEVLILNDNAIAEIAPYTFKDKTRLRHVDLTVNKMRTVDRTALSIAPEAAVVTSGQPPSFLLGGNLLECTCDMVWLQSVNRRSDGGGSSLPRIADLESIYCQLPYVRDALAQPAFAPMVDVRPSDFLCAYRTHCFALCHCCDYDACDCEMACPAGCSCYRDSTWTNNIVQCSGGNNTQLPVKIPMDATEIFLDGNNLGRLKSHTFIGRKNLRVLHLNHSNILVVDNNTFNGLPAMAVLHLEGNRLTKLEGDEFQGRRRKRMI
jgi:Leucine-rich repeat (LRR) protein